MLCRKQISKTTIKGDNFSAKTTKGRKDKRYKLYRVNFVTMPTFLLKFMSTTQGSNRGALVARCVQVKYPYIKNTPCHLPQKPLACISALASSHLLAVAGETTLEDSGCSGGSMRTSWQTSRCQLAVRSLSSLCLIKVNPPWRQIIQCLVLLLVSHTQWFCNCQLYRKHNASRNSCLFRWKPFSWIGRAVSHREEHFTLVALKEWIQLRVNVTVLRLLKLLMNFRLDELKRRNMNLFRLLKDKVS